MGLHDHVISYARLELFLAAEFCAGELCDWEGGRIVRHDGTVEAGLVRARVWTHTVYSELQYTVYSNHLSRYLNTCIR